MKLQQEVLWTNLKPLIFGCAFYLIFAAGIIVMLATNTGIVASAWALILRMLMLIALILLVFFWQSHSIKKRTAKMLSPFSGEDLRNADRQAQECSFCIGRNVKLTETALIYISAFSYVVIPTRQIVWCYFAFDRPSRTRKNQLFVITKQGIRVPLRLKKTSLEEILTFEEKVKEYRPHALLGFSEKRWQMGKRQFDVLSRMSDGGSEEA